MNVGDHRIAVRYKVRGKLEVGQEFVALNLGVGLRSVKRLWKKTRQDTGDKGAIRAASNQHEKLQRN